MFPGSFEKVGCSCDTIRKRYLAVFHAVNFGIGLGNRNDAICVGTTVLDVIYATLVQPNKDKRCISLKITARCSCGTRQCGPLFAALVTRVYDIFLQRLAISSTRIFQIFRLYPTPDKQTGCPSDQSDPDKLAFVVLRQCIELSLHGL